MTTFEEACKISRDAFNEILRDPTAPSMAERLAGTGWTLETLTDEARRRMHERIKFACRRCGGPTKRLGPGVYAHDNTSGWYAGREIDHDAEVKS